MRLADRRHLLPGAAAFVAALLVALLGLSAGADEPAPSVRPPPRADRRASAARRERLPRAPRAAAARPRWRGVARRLARPRRDARTPSAPSASTRATWSAPRRFISSRFADEPTIEADQPAWASTSGTLGNHEFDEGGGEALRLVGRADYPYVAANTVTRDGGELILPPYEIVERAGVKVGFIGVTTADTPFFLLSEFAREFRWLDLSDSVNRWVPELRRRGVEAIVVLAHAGAFQRATPPRARSSTRHARWTTPSTWWWPATPTRPSTSRWTASSWWRPSPTAWPSTGCGSRSTVRPATSSRAPPQVRRTRHDGVARTRSWPRSSTRPPAPWPRWATGWSGGRALPRPRASRPARRGRPARLRGRRPGLPQPGQHARRLERRPDHLRRRLRGPRLRAPRLALSHARRRPARASWPSDPDCSSPARGDLEPEAASTPSPPTASWPSASPSARDSPRARRHRPGGAGGLARVARRLKLDRSGPSSRSASAGNTSTEITPPATRPAAAAAVELAQLDADLGRGHDERQRGGLEQARREQPAAGQEAAVHQRREAADQRAARSP